MSDTSDPFASLDPASQALISQLMGGVGAAGVSGDSGILSTVWGNSLSSDAVVQSRERKARTPPPGSTPYLPGGATDAQAAEFKNSYTTGYTDFTGSEIFNEIFNISQKDPNDWANIQQQLYLAGFYGNKELAELSFGAIDDDDVNAISQVLTWTARQNAADRANGGKGLTDWRDVLGSYAKELIGPKLEALAKSMRGGQPNKVTLADPAGLALAIDDVARNVLGRKANADEKKLFVSTFHAMQSSQQSADTGTVMAPDAQGQAEAQLRAANPEEAGAHDLSTTFNDFLQILSGGFD